MYNPTTPSPTIEWVDRYPLLNVPGSFTLFTSKHSNGLFHGTVYFYTKTAPSSKDDPPVLTFDGHFEIGTSIETVVDGCLKWSRSKFGSEVSLGERQRLQPQAQ